MSNTYRFIEPGWGPKDPQWPARLGNPTEKMQKKDRRSRQHKKHNRFSKYGGIDRKQRQEELREKEDIQLPTQYDITN